MGRVGTPGVSGAEWLRGEEGVRRGRGVGSLHGEEGERRAEVGQVASDPMVPRVHPEDRGIQDPEARLGVEGLQVRVALTLLERW